MLLKKLKLTVRCDELFSTATYAKNLRFGKKLLGERSLNESYFTKPQGFGTDLVISN